MAMGGVLPWEYHAHNECSSRRLRAQTISLTVVKHGDR